MKRICAIIAAMLCFSGYVLAQDVPKAEIFGGYSYAHAGTNLDNSLNMNGWNVAVTGNINSWLGVVVDVAQHFGSTSSPDLDHELRSFMVGPQFAIRRHEKITPFFRGMIGDARIGQSSGDRRIYHENCFSMILGGGIDIGVHPVVAIRVIQADYQMTMFSNDTQNDVRLSFGVVFRLGEK